MAWLALSAMTDTPVVHSDAPSDIVGVVWHDIDLNGTRDDGEPGIANWDVALYDNRSECVRPDPEIEVCSPAPSVTVVTDTSGGFQIADVPPQRGVSVCITMASGWIVTAAVGSIRGIGCYLLPNALNIDVSLEKGEDVTLGIGVAEADVSMTAELTCPSAVAVGVLFQCTAWYRNTGSFPSHEVNAGASNGVCWDSAPHIPGPGCVAKGAFGRQSTIEFLSADPAWTGRTIQYGHPEWAPLLAGTLAPSGATNIRLRLRANATNAAGQQEMVCAGVSGVALFGDHPAPVRTHAYSCEEITVRATALGDADCNEIVNSIDALVILQNVAGLLTSLACPDLADANGDGAIDSVDAALVLQYSAGLLSQLPP